MRKQFFILVMGVLPFFITKSAAQVTADFTANNTRGCGSLQVSFSDQSSSTAGNIVSWLWDLGGVSSSSQNPGRIFGTPGFYRICLTVEDSQGNTDTECKNSYIQVLHNPVAEFMVDDATGCVPHIATFTDQSTSQDGRINQWIWGVGGSTGVVVQDGTTVPVSSTYNVPDEYTTSLTVFDDNGCSNTITKTDHIVVSPDPEIYISASDTFSCEAPFIVSFTNASPLADVQFVWDFGDNTGFTGTTPPPKSYNQQGVYSVTVTATNTVTGCTNTLEMIDWIKVGHPTYFEYSPNEGCEGLSVAFTDNSPEPADSVRWDFGDGEVSMAANPSHVYDSQGCYFVTFTRWIDGCQTTIPANECIRIHPIPQPTYTNDNPLGCTVPHTVNFTGAGFGIQDWDWDFGDGNSSTQRNPTHTYDSLGIFPVTLTVTTAEGCSAVISTDTIKIVELEARIGSDRFFDCGPLDVTLNEQSISVVPITGWTWEVINNASSPPVVYTSMDEQPSFTLSDTGRWQIRLIITNAIGCVDTGVFENMIGVGMPPVIDFDATPRETCVSSPVSFDDLSSSFADEWNWDFGDGGVSDAQYPIYEYTDTGYFDVTLVAFHLGCRNRLTIDSFIHVNPPKARFDVIRECETPFTVEADDLSIGADRIHWDFGVEGTENDTFNIAEPIYTYPNTGRYTITQVVENFTTGCTDTATMAIVITDPLVRFNVPVTEGCVPLNIQMEDNSAFGNVYEWSAPGASISDRTVPNPVISYNNTGKFTDIQLIITDVNQCTDTLVFQDTITVNGVNANFTIDPSGGCMPLTVNFNDQSSSVFGTNTTWEWTFGDNLGTSNDLNPVFDFDVVGEHTVSLTVTDSWGCQQTRTFIDTIDVTFPIAAFEVDTLGCTQSVISFTNRSNGKQLSYFWDFGDGNTSTQANPTHNYTSEGVYDICLTATDLYGCDSTLCLPQSVVIADPVALFSADTTHADCPPLLVSFQSDAINGLNYSWDFGDSSGTSIAENPQHVYTIPGVYDVTLIVSSTDDCVDTLVMQDYIRIEGPVGSFTFDIDTACIPETVTFFGESAEPYTFVWDFGNGVLDSTLNTQMDTFPYVYNEVGEFVPKLILINDQGCARTIESPDTIRMARLDIEFMAMDSILCNDASASFLNLTNSSRPIIYQEWLFPGANPDRSTSFEPNVVFDTAGTKDIYLIVDNGFCRDTLVKEDYIRIGGIPQANFTASATVACQPSTIFFTDNSSIPDEVITDWNWMIGDSIFSTDQNSNYTFDEPGVYDISLIVFSEVGCQDTMTQQITIHAKPIVDLGEEPVVCIGESAFLNVIVSSDVTDYRWLANPALSCTDCLNPEVVSMDTVILTFISSNANGCSDTSQISVNVRPYEVPDIVISQDTSICYEDIAMISVSGGDSPESYQWDRNRVGLSCYESCPNTVASPLATTTYIVTVTSQFGCSSRDSVTINVVDERQKFVTEDRIICDGDTTQLGINIGNDPIWLNTDGLSCGQCPDPLAYPDTTTTYGIRVTTDMGCRLYDSVTIQVMYSEDIDAGEDQTVCLGETSILEGSILAGDVVWTPGTGISNVNEVMPAITPVVSDTYYMTVTNDDCILVDSMYLEVKEKVSITGMDTIICEGESVTINIDSDAETFYWLPPDRISDVTISNPIVAPLKTSTYHVIGQLSTCEPDTAEVYIEVIPKPQTGVIPVWQSFPGQTVKLNTQTDTTGNFTFEWWPPINLSCRTCSNPAATVDTTTTYTLIVTDTTTGCMDTVQTTVEINDTCPDNLISVPNIFTPNGDDVNDILYLYPSPAFEEIKSFIIYDRWGSVVFRTNDISDGWNGNINGQQAQSGVYVYLLEAICPLNGTPIYKSGDITMIRN